MKILTRLALLAAILVPAQLTADDFTSAAATYYDGSLWFASDGGILRVGRNGRSIFYSREVIGADPAAVISDKSGGIWILCSDSRVRNYSFVDGFIPFAGLPSGITAIASDDSEGVLYAAGSGVLYSWLPEAVKADTLSLLATPVKSIITAGGGALWLMSEGACYRYEKESGAVLVSNVSQSPDVSNSISFKIETNTTPVRSGGGLKAVWVVLLSLLCAVSGLLAGLFFTKKRKPVSLSGEKKTTPAVVINKPVTTTIATNKEVVKSPAPVPVKPPVSEALFPEPEEEPDDDFVALVKSIIAENIATPKFGVDEIAAITGISRIHVNRKLKAAGAPSPSVMLKDARMKAAASLVLDGRYSFQEIASRCGFSSPSYFATSFRDYYGVTPSEYKDKQ